MAAKKKPITVGLACNKGNEKVRLYVAQAGKNVDIRYKSTEFDYTIGRLEPNGYLHLAEGLDPDCGLRLDKNNRIMVKRDC